MSTLTKCGVSITFSDKAPLTLTYNNLSLPVIRNFTKTQIIGLIAVCDSKEQILVIINAVTK